MRKVLFIADELPPDCGGAGMMAAFMIEGLARLGHDVSVITRAPAWNAGQSRVQVHSIRCLKHFYLYVPAYAGQFKKTDWASQDVVIVNDCAASTAAALLLQPDVIDKCIFFLHGSEPEMFYGNKDWFYSLFQVGRAYSRSLSASRAVVAVSRAMKEKFLRISGESSLADKIGILHNAIESRYFQPGARVGKTVGHQVLLSVGRIDSRKGYPRMLDIFRRLVEGGQDFHWIVVGEGPYLETMRRRVHAENLQDLIRFMGYRAKEELRDLYGSADVFWTLSDYEEAFGLVYIEANACGIPVIAWNKGGTDESVSPGSSGYLVESEEECMEILAGRRYLDIPLERILRHAAQFSEDRFFSQLESLLTV